MWRPSRDDNNRTVPFFSVYYECVWSHYIQMPRWRRHTFAVALNNYHTRTHTDTHTHTHALTEHLYRDGIQHTPQTPCSRTHEQAKHTHTDLSAMMMILMLVLGAVAYWSIPWPLSRSLHLRTCAHGGHTQVLCSLDRSQSYTKHTRDTH